ncbi:MAG: alpha/beta fold hydrolase [Erysipelotrichaceae bacterium]|nr:alpha/beta fold hydrolase [Erysipelotrichaceae bacterium]
MKEFFYASADKVNQIHAGCWEPEGQPKAVLQIVHGMQEYFGRYDAFAQFLAKNGYLVVAEDHLGHGASVQKDEDHGYFGENGNEWLIKDIRQLHLDTRKKYPGIPYFLLGHSMGSFLARQYIERYSPDLDGAIIMGTGWTEEGVLKSGKTLCSLMAKFKGWRHRSPMVEKIAFGSYNKEFQPAETRVEWLTKEKFIKDKYLQDPWCTFKFTLNGYYTLFSAIGDEQKEENIAGIRKDLPVFFVSGEKDPVGDYGKGVQKSYEAFKKAGILNVQMKLYPDDRHEILNETDREAVYQDLLNWLESIRLRNTI